MQIRAEALLSTKHGGLSGLSLQPDRGCLLSRPHEQGQGGLVLGLRVECGQALCLGCAQESLVRGNQHKIVTASMQLLSNSQCRFESDCICGVNRMTDDERKSGGGKAITDRQLVNVR